MRAYPAAPAKVWIDGDVHAFTFFGKVPASILYDNDRCLVAKVLPDGTRKRATLFSGFLAHYLFCDHYGRPGKGNDKGNAEGLAGYSRRKHQADVLRGESETIGQRLARDPAAISGLPAAPFDACNQATGRVCSQVLPCHST